MVGDSIGRLLPHDFLFYLYVKIFTQPILEQIFQETLFRYLCKQSGWTSPRILK